MYAFALISPPCDWYLQIDNSKIVGVKKFIKILEKQLVYAYPSFILLLAVKPSVTSSEYQKHVFQRLMKDTAAAHLIEKFGESATVSENLTYQAISFVQKYISWKNQ